MIPKEWNKESYNVFVNYLISIEDTQYRKFHSSLVTNSKYKIIGIRVPIMKKIAKEIVKTSNIEDFLKYSQDKYYEEIMIQGLVISQIKDEKLFYNYFKKHIIKIDNWALCDTFCASLKIINKNKEKYYNEAVKLSLSKKEFISRVGLIILLNYYIEDKYIDQIFEILNTIDSDEFYVNMAMAWVISEMYIKYKEKTIMFIKNNKLNKFTLNKAISKICDSYRVSDEEKEYLRKIKKERIINE